MENNILLIKLEKPYYYPDEIIKGNVYVNIEEEMKPGIELRIKGKQILKVNLDSFKNKSFEEEKEENEKNNNSNTNDFEDGEKGNNNLSYDSENKEKDFENYKYNDDIELFDSKSFLSNDNLNIGQYIFPFLFKLNNNVPGTCLLYEKNLFGEIYYSIRVKIENKNGKIFKEKIPLIIRQNENDFKYQLESNISKNFNSSCCCNSGKVKINCKLSKKYFSFGDQVNLNFFLDNKKGKMEGGPTIAILYKKIILHPNKNDMLEIPIEIEKIENHDRIKIKGEYSNTFIFNYQGNLIQSDEVLEMSKNYKLINNINLLKYLCCSCLNNSFSCEYEFFVNTNFISWTLDDIGIFISTIFYPPENISDFLKEKILFNFKGKTMNITKINYSELVDFIDDDEISFGKNFIENNQMNINSSFMDKSSRKLDDKSEKEKDESTTKEINSLKNNIFISEQTKKSKYSLTSNNVTIKKDFNQDWIDSEIESKTLGEESLK